MKRVILIGSPGSGKFTMSRELANILELELYHLDNLFWKPGWVSVPRDEQIAITKDLIKRDSWMIDGNYTGTLDLRLEQADFVVFFDLPRSICMFRIFKRIWQYRNKKRPDMNAGTERLNRDFVKYVWNFRKNIRPRIYEKLNKHPDLQVSTLKSKKDVNKFVNQIKVEKHDLRV